MYNAFFGFTLNPFNMSPDPSFLFRSRQHEEALANLIYGVQSRKGFILLTGEVGTGKTTMLECLRDFLNAQQITFASLFNSRLTVAQFFEMLAYDFGLNCNRLSKTEVLLALNHMLLDRTAAGRTTVLIVDEALAVVHFSRGPVQRNSFHRDLIFTKNAKRCCRLRHCFTREYARKQKAPKFAIAFEAAQQQPYRGRSYGRPVALGQDSCHAGKNLPWVSVIRVAWAAFRKDCRPIFALAQFLLSQFRRSLWRTRTWQLKKPPQQNSWVNSGSGRAASV